MQQLAESHELFRLINNAHSPAGDMFFGVVSGLGDGLIVALICSLLMLFRLRLGIAALLAFILSGLFAQILKRQMPNWDVDEMFEEDRYINARTYVSDHVPVFAVFRTDVVDDD